MFVPKYRRISDVIFQTYIDQHLDTKTNLPAEEALASQFNVSRTTIRKALDLLVDQGYVNQSKGKGYFIQNQKNQVSTTQDTLGLFEDSLLKKTYSTTKIISRDIISCTPFLAEKLQIHPNDKVFHITRLRYIKDEISSLTENYIPLALVPDIIEESFPDGSLWNYLKKQGYQPRIMNQDIEVRPSREKEQFYLNIDESTPVLIIQNTAFHHKKPIDYSILINNAYKSRMQFSYQ